MKVIITVKKKFSGNKMLVPEIVDKIINLYSIGWGKKKIAGELGISPKTVRRYISQKEWQPYRNPIRQRKLEGLEKWLEETFLLHKGNAAVVHQQLERQHNIFVNISTVERAIRTFRQKLISKINCNSPF